MSVMSHRSITTFIGTFLVITTVSQGANAQNGSHASSAQNDPDSSLRIKLPVLIVTPQKEEETVQDGAPQSGEGWEVIKEERWEEMAEEQAKQKIDPRLAALAKFFDKEQKE